MALDRNDFVPVEGDLSFVPGTSHVVPGSQRSNLDSNLIGGRNVSPASLTVPVDDHGSLGSGIVPDSLDVSPGDSSLPDLQIHDRTITSKDIPIWTPDPNGSPEDNLNSLMSYIKNLLTPSGFLNGSYNTSALDYLNTLNAMFYSLDAFDFIPYLDKATMISLAEKITDVAQSYVNSQYQSALAYQSWYLQQEYNSPINQVNRLAAAGLSSAFAIGNLNSGNASSPAGVPNVEQVQSSNAGQVQAQEDAKRSGLFGEIFGAIASMVPAVGGAAAALVQASCTKMMTPIQISKMGADIANSAANQEMLRATADAAKVNSALNIFTQQRQYSAQLLQNAGQEVDTSKLAYDTAFNNSEFTVEQEELQWETHVTTKSGESKTVTLSNDQIEKAISNRGVLEDGSVIDGSSTWNVNASASQGVKAGIPGIGSASGKLSLGGGYSSSSGRSDSSKSISENASSMGDQHSEGKYSDDGSSFSIGDSTFTSVTTRRRVPLPQHAAHIKALYNRYQSAVDRFNSLSSGQRAYLDRLADELTRGLSTLSAGATNSLMKYQIDNFLVPKPNTMIGD